MSASRTYAAHDAALRSLGKEESRALLEVALAWHILNEAALAEADPEHAPYFRGEINGLCVALRLLGGYEGVAFDGEWARAIRPATFDWRRFLGYPKGGEGGARAATPRPAITKDRKESVMSESEDLRTLAERGELVLRTRGGEVAARLVAPPALSLMAANGRPPEGLAWGERYFSLTPDGRYVEGLLYVLLSPRVIGGE